jgi:hypothetical protein
MMRGTPTKIKTIACRARGNTSRSCVDSNDYVIYLRAIQTPIVVQSWVETSGLVTFRLCQRSRLGRDMHVLSLQAQPRSLRLIWETGTARGRALVTWMRDPAFDPLHFHGLDADHIYWYFQKLSSEYLRFLLLYIYMSIINP